MRRIGLAVALALSLTLAPVAADAQQAVKLDRVGYINPGYASDPVRLRRFDAFRDGLRELGYVEGRNIAIESRWAEGKDDRYQALAADLVGLNVDVIVTLGGAATKATQQVTKKIPIVMSLVNDPVGSGLVSNLARPGGNVTGTSLMAPDLVGKQLGVLKEIVPNVSRVAILRQPSNPASAAQSREADSAARVLGMRLQTFEARNPPEIDRAFAAMTRDGAAALVVLTDSIFTNQRGQIAERASKGRLPAVFGNSEHVVAGGLIGYSASFLDLERRAATYVDKILKGAKPGDLPVEQPTKFELVINMKTAKALGLTIPQTLLLRADQIIE
jgi:putative ABC transport system substrate-binding protein